MILVVVLEFQKMSITLKFLSEKTGYSMITISRAINHPHLVQEKSREKILDAIEKYEYSPNNVAKALVYKRTNIIHIYIPEDLSPTNQFVMQVNAGIGSYLGDKGYSILISNKWYRNQSVDGLILMGLSIRDESHLRKLSNEKPLVLFGHDDYVTSVDVDNVMGVEIATDHAVGCGYKNIGFIGIKQNKKFTKDRYMGYQKSLSKHQIEENSQHVIFVDNNSDAGYQAALSLLASNKEIDCIVCSSDDLATGVIQAAKEMNRKIPESLGVIGYDGLGTELITHPKLTTVHQPIYEVGLELAKLVINKIEKNIEKPIIKYLKPSLIIGQTTTNK